jgi:hypothetical protein
VADDEAVSGAHERQPEQLGIAFDMRQHVGVGELQVLESGVEVSGPSGIEQSVKTEAFYEPSNLPGCHGPLLQIDEMNGDTALFATRRSLKNRSAARVAAEFFTPKIWTLND